MLNIFNRKELITVYTMEDQSRIRDTLSSNNIDYSMKTINRNSSSAFNDTRARTGAFMQNMNIAYEYIFYVSKPNCERASQAINVIKNI